MTLVELIEHEARRLVELAEKNGVILTIEREPLPPPRMGNHVAVIRTWPKREVAVPGKRWWAVSCGRSSPYKWSGPGLEPDKWIAADGTVVYRTEADLWND